MTFTNIGISLNRETKDVPSFTVSTTSLTHFFNAGERQAQEFPLALSSKGVDLAFMCELHKPKQALELMGCFLLKKKKPKTNLFMFENSILGKVQKVPLWVTGDVPPEEAGVSSGNHQG